MKIVIVNRHAEDVVGGSEIQCDSIAASLTKSGHDVVYVAPFGDKQKQYQRPYKVLPVANKSCDIAAAIIKEEPDLVYWRFNKYFFKNVSKKIAERNIPIVFAISHVNDTRLWSARENPRHGILQALRYIKQGFENLYNHSGFRHVAAVTANNPDYIGRLPAKRQKFIPNSVNETEEVFSWPRPYIVWVSNLKPAKRPELYYKLAQTLKNEDVDFLMVGDIQSTHYNWIADKGLSPNFYYLGKKSLEQINGILAGSLCFVHTCAPEGFPSVFIQSWMKEKPTITLGFDPASYIEKNELGANAHENWKRFVSEVLTMIQNPELREAAGRKALAFARGAFSGEQATAALESFMQDIVREHTQKPPEIRDLAQMIRLTKPDSPESFSYSVEFPAYRK